MAKKVTITLDEELLAFVDQQAAALGTKPNRSRYINALIAAHRDSVMEIEMVLAHNQESENSEKHRELAAWDYLIWDDIDLFD